MFKKTNFKNSPLFVLLALSLILLLSCSKTPVKNTKTETIAPDTSGVSEFKESNEDLLTVDYNYFYGELSGKGEWIEVNAKDMGIDIKPRTTGSLDGMPADLFADLLGVRTAFAQTDADLFKLFVWRPSVELASQMISEDQKKPIEYAPYNNGQWIYTDAGWYFKANPPQEDLTCHYGRWTQDPNLGWVWLPGKVWSPAWVDWRENDNYVAWA